MRMRMPVRARVGGRAVQLGARRGVRVCHAGRDESCKLQFGKRRQRAILFSPPVLVLVLVRGRGLRFVARREYVDVWDLHGHRERELALCVLGTQQVRAALERGVIPGRGRGVPGRLAGPIGSDDSEYERRGRYARGVRPICQSRRLIEYANGAGGCALIAAARAAGSPR